MTDEHTHLIAFPEALGALLARMGELRAALGPRIAPRVDAVEQSLRDGLAARDRGDGRAAVSHVGQAMDRLAALASEADPTEGAVLRAVATQFRGALDRGALGEAREAAETMRVRSGSVVRPRRP